MDYQYCDNCGKHVEEDEQFEVIIKGTRVYMFVCEECRDDEEFILVL